MLIQGASVSENCNEYNSNLLARENEKIFSVPAAAVIPALMAYIQIAAVETLVVEA